jgi:hypothetical protein
MKLHQKIFGIGLVTAVIVPHLFEKGYRTFYQLSTAISFGRGHEFGLCARMKTIY